MIGAVSPVPVVAAGGIADGRALPAVLTLGAAGAWIGTRFLASEEANIHPLYRDRLLAACETDTLHTNLFDVGWPHAPHRVLRNSTVQTWEAAGRPQTGSRPGEGETIATTAEGAVMVRYQSATPQKGAVGVIEGLSLWAGQGVSSVKSIQPAGDIVRELVFQAQEALRAGADLAGS